MAKRMSGAHRVRARIAARSTARRFTIRGLAQSLGIRGQAVAHAVLKLKREGLVKQVGHGAYKRIGDPTKITKMRGLRAANGNGHRRKHRAATRPMVITPAAATICRPHAIGLLDQAIGLIKKARDEVAQSNSMDPKMLISELQKRLGVQAS